jgi:hypothetical protein
VEVFGGGWIQSEVLMRRIFATLLLVLLPAASIANEMAAQDWAKAMFDHTTHNFGMVARGASAEHRFPLENIYLEDAHIKSIHSSCKCTTVKVTKPSLKTYETAEIVATLDTRKFTGSKDATIRVVFDKPFPAEVQLHVRSYIRTDVVLEPGSVQFGQITEGSAVTKTVTLRHAGSPDWKITGIEKQDEHIEVALTPLSTESSQATYRLEFTLMASAPPGYIRRHLTLLTNDKNPNAKRVLVPIEGVVSPAVSVRPSPLPFGVLHPGTRKTLKLVVQGQEPFQVLEMVAPDDRFRFSSGVKLRTSSRLHLLPVTFSAGLEPGKITGQILIRTDIGENRTLRVNVSGEVVSDSPKTSVPAQVSEKDAPADKSQSTDGWHSADG